MALSGLCGASVRGCHISTAHTAALCPARGWISMDPLTGLSSRTFPQSTGARVGFASHNTWQGYAKTACARDDKTKATLSNVYWKLISSSPSFCIHKTQDGRERDDVGLGRVLSQEIRLGIMVLCVSTKIYKKPHAAKRVLQPGQFIPGVILPGPLQFPYTCFPRRSLLLLCLCPARATPTNQPPGFILFLPYLQFKAC